MAVFTPVSPIELSHWLSDHQAGSLLTLTPIASGIENTNYFVDTSSGHHVLTLFEKLGPAELPYYLGLMQHLAQQGLPCPKPLPLSHNALFSPLKGKPAALVSRLRGSSVIAPTLGQCEQIGKVLAQMHLAGATYTLHQENPRGTPWIQSTARQLSHLLDSGQQQRLSQALTIAPSFDPTLPHGPIHGDLFRDNVLFEGEHVSGLIDFYFAGDDNWIYDLAIVVNDWCMTPEARLDATRVTALVGAYRANRPVQPTEQATWSSQLTRAALRFWLSRLHDLHQPRASQLLQPHDPAWFDNVLSHHLEQPPSWPC